MSIRNSPSRHNHEDGSRLPRPTGGRRRRVVVCLIVLLVIVLSLTSLIRSTSIANSIPWNAFQDHLLPHQNVWHSTVFLDMQPFSPQLGRFLPFEETDEDTDITQSYPYADSADIEDMERRVFPKHEYDEHCIPMAEWQTTFHPTCNEIHANDMVTALKQYRFWLLSVKGFWRFAWEYVETAPGDKHIDVAYYRHDKSVVLKTFKLQHNFEEGYFENNRVDAIAMEQLTKSPYVVNMYGYCGVSVMTEFAGQQISKVVDGLSPLARLRLAKMVAQGVADVHGIDGGDQVTLVHNDLNFANIVIGKKHNLPVVNDFNVAVLMMKHNETGEQCRFTSHYPNPQWRAPEEQVEEETGISNQFLNEKIDIYALGNILYRFAVGHSPWKVPGRTSLSPEQKKFVAALKIYNGTLPAIPSRVYNNTDPSIGALLKIMSECYQHDPELRPTAQQVVDMLQDAIDMVGAIEESHMDEVKEDAEAELNKVFKKDDQGEDDMEKEETKQRHRKNRKKEEKIKIKKRHRSHES